MFINTPDKQGDDYDDNNIIPLYFIVNDGFMPHVNILCDLYTCPFLIYANHTCLDLIYEPVIIILIFCYESSNNNIDVNDYDLFNGNKNYENV